MAKKNLLMCGCGKMTPDDEAHACKVQVYMTEKDASKREEKRR